MSAKAKKQWESGNLGGEEWRRKISEGSKVAWARGDYDGEETRKKMSETSKQMWASGKMDNRNTPEYRKKLSRTTKAAWVRGDYDGNFTAEEVRRRRSILLKQQWARGDMDGVFTSPTSIEIKMATALEICGIQHISQYRPEGYSRTFDEFILPNILLEIHGDYWHGPERPKQQQKDEEKKRWAIDNGFIFLVVWEHEIRRVGAWSIVINRILPLLSNKSNRE